MNAESKYVIQEGPAKDLFFRLSYAMYRSNMARTAATRLTQQLSLIVEYPLNIL